MPQFKFVTSAADKAVRFFAQQLTHTIGAQSGKPFKLLPWQKQIVHDLFGWKREDGTRKYRTAYIEVPRKNGKSTFAAGLALYLLLEDNEARAHVVSAAGDRRQARIVFDTARAMVEASDALQERVDIYQYDLRGIALKSKYEAVSAEAYSKHGGDLHGIIFDELHVQPNRELWDVLTTSVGARRQPLTIAITTAGFDRSSICWEMHQRAKRAIADPESDPAFYPVIYGAEESDDWTDEQVWIKANPSIGDALQLSYLKEKCDEAKANAALENTFRNLHLNQWTQQSVRWLSMQDWSKCTGIVASEDELAGKPCYVGIDLASTMDVCAMAFVFPLDNDCFAVKCHYFAPEEAKNIRTKSDRRQIENWISIGKIESCPGNEMDYAWLAKRFCDISQRYSLQGIAYDPWGAVAFVQMLQASGVDYELLTKFGQTIANFAAPTKEFGRLIHSHKIDHLNDPVLRWMAENVAVKQDASGNMRPDKAKSADKIDGIVATIMGLALAIKQTPQTWYYEHNELEMA
jgi:phage terminase large subunit-like protein